MAWQRLMIDRANSFPLNTMPTTWHVSSTKELTLCNHKQTKIEDDHLTSCLTSPKSCHESFLAWFALRRKQETNINIQNHTTTLLSFHLNFSPKESRQLRIIYLYIYYIILYYYKTMRIMWWFNALFFIWPISH